jgi:hypothetical protein
MKLLFYLVFSSTLLAEVNPWGLSLFERIVNRKHISHIIMEVRPDHYRVSLIVSDRFPYNYKTVSYAFYLKYKDAPTAQKTAEILDKHLDLGLEVKLYLKGSEISSYQLLGKE